MKARVIFVRNLTERTPDMQVMVFLLFPSQNYFIFSLHLNLFPSFLVILICFSFYHLLLSYCLFLSFHHFLFLLFLMSIFAYPSDIFDCVIFFSTCLFLSFLVFPIYHFLFYHSVLVPFLYHSIIFFSYVILGVHHFIIFSLSLLTLFVLNL